MLGVFDAFSVSSSVNHGCKVAVTLLKKKRDKERINVLILEHPLKLQFLPRLLGIPEVTANLYCNCVHLHGEGSVFCSTNLR